MDGVRALAADAVCEAAQCQLNLEVAARPALRTADIAEDGVEPRDALVSFADDNLGAGGDDFLAVFLRVAFDEGVGGRDEGKEEERRSEHDVGFG